MSHRLPEVPARGERPQALGLRAVLTRSPSLLRAPPWAPSARASALCPPQGRWPGTACSCCSVTGRPRRPAPWRWLWWVLAGGAATLVQRPPLQGPPLHVRLAGTGAEGPGQAGSQVLTWGHGVTTDPGVRSGTVVRRRAVATPRALAGGRRSRGGPAGGVLSARRGGQEGPGRVHVQLRGASVCSWDSGQGSAELWEAPGDSRSRGTEAAPGDGRRGVRGQGGQQRGRAGGSLEGRVGGVRKCVSPGPQDGEPSCGTRTWGSVVAWVRR